MVHWQGKPKVMVRAILKTNQVTKGQQQTNKHLCLKNLAPYLFFCSTFLSIAAPLLPTCCPPHCPPAAHVPLCCCPLLPFSDRALLPRLPSFLSFFLRQALAMAEEERHEEEEEEDEEGKRRTRTTRRKEEFVDETRCGTRRYAK